MTQNPFLDPNNEVNQDFPPTQREEFEEKISKEVDSFNWVDVVATEVVGALRNWGKDNGYSSAIVGNIYNDHARQMFTELEDYFSGRNVVEPGGMGPPGGSNLSGFTQTPQGMQQMVDWAINWFGGKVGIPLRRGSSGGGGGGGGGRRGPTAADIRNQFDLKELAANINDMNRAMVFEEHKDAKGLAKKYVDAVVATRGEKKIDFATFVEEQIANTARFKSIYRKKPEHLSWSEYMGPYIGAARQFAAPEDADDIAIGGAQFGASPEAFRQRLNREDSVTGSAPFIQGLEGRMRELNSLFKG